MQKLLMETRPTIGIGFKTTQPVEKVRLFVEACLAEGIVTAVHTAVDDESSRLSITRTITTESPNVLDALRAHYFPDREALLTEYTMEGHVFSELPEFNTELSVTDTSTFDNFVNKYATL